MRTIPGLCLGLLSCVVLCCAAQAASQIRTVNGVTANDLAYDKVNNRLYVTVPSSAGAGGNSLRIIDPVAGTAGPAVFVGSEPGKIAVSHNGQFAYVGLNGSAAVRQVNLGNFTAGQQFPLGSDQFLGLYYVDDIEVMPGSPQTIAVSLRNQGFSPRHEGVAIFDNGVMRPTTTPGHTGSNVIEFGATPDRLYGYNNETTDFGFRTMNITPSGVQITNTSSGLISGFGVDIDYGGNKIVSTSGRVIDAANRSLLGGLGASGPVAVEEDGSRAYILAGNTIHVFDLNTFLSIDTIVVPGLSGGSDIVRFGGDGLAVRGTNALYLINSTSVPEPGAGIVILAATALTLRRRARIAK